MNRSTFLRAAAVTVAAATTTVFAAGGANAAADHRPSRAFTVTHVGGPTTILEIAGARILLDPTFDQPQKYPSGLEKTQGPALSVDQIGKIDAVLLSHDQHDDNLDTKGRELLAKVPVVLSTPGARKRLGAHITPMKSWESTTLKTARGGIRVTALPALHGPDGVDRGEDGEVTGFLLSGKGVPTTYVSGDNASVKLAKSVGDRIRRQYGRIDTAILFAGAARTPAILDNAPLTLTSQGAAEVAEHLNPRKVVAVHTDSWNIYSEDLKSLVMAFWEKGIADKVVDVRPAGTKKSLS
ncbi:MBL fold metallo-hydrolase [Bailinhaonella thermotolerans]|uniref:MBL fold metallo-hydrolase n=1 Tax=Bailinhaonella thermotolerans TaxID=1070861 RepID=A0A3A4BGF2_9ACTN|nr:MBL fold metallo-hydrolase [Bailinhaonella thermotolerans]RJL33582.1 MBL fold metallo-hydrolase [Bailinhaonella thermotolerans]